jgi:calcium permeable stress-gated cation channel
LVSQGSFCSLPSSLSYSLTSSAIAYSCIAPLILGFAAVGLYLFYLSYRYNLLYVLQPKVDSRGECYGRALRHLITGIYLSELCLIGLFGAREAPGPSALMIILLIATIIYHSILNRVLTSVKANIAVNEEGEAVPLLAAEEGNAEHVEHNASRSKAADIGLSQLPSSISEPVAKAVGSYIASSRSRVRSWMNDPSARQPEDEIQYTDEEIRTAYLHPALTSKTPKLWLVRDEAGVSTHEIEANEAVGIAATDEGAFLDPRNRVVWAQDDFGRVPIFKIPVNY